jgi:hypothetical protein
MLQRAVETLDHFPAIAQLEKIALELDVTGAQKWAYEQASIASCSQCEGCGYVWVFNPQQGFEGIVCCDDCPTGKNLQIAPEKTRINKRLPQHVYIAPGNAPRRILDKFQLKAVPKDNQNESA